MTAHRTMLRAALAAILPAIAFAGAAGSPAAAPSGPLSVAEAVRIAVRESPGVRGAQADAAAARAETRMARAMAHPQVSANVLVSAGGMAATLSGAPDVTPSLTRDVPARASAVQNLSAMVPLYTGGRIGSQVRAAAEREHAAEASAGGQQSAAAEAVREAYYRALLGAEMVRVAQTRVDAASAMLGVARSMYEAGKGIEAAMQRARAEAADAERMQIAARADADRALLDLRAAMGVRLDAAITLSDALAYEASPGDLASSLSGALRDHPDLAAARARAAAAGADVSAARGSLAPQVYGSLMADTFQSRAMGNGAGVAAGVAVSLPLLDSGQRRAQVARAQAMRDRAAEDLRAAEIAVAGDVRRAWLEIETAAESVRAARAGLEAAQAAYDVTVLRVQNQKAILVEQLDASAALTQARANVAQALYDHAVAAARLRRATGRV